MTKIAIVDIETTGPRIEEGDQIIQIAAVIIEEGHIIQEHNMLINPEIEIPFHISQLTGINQEVVLKAPTFKQVAGLWYERLRDCVFVAHNLALDLNFLQENFRLHGYESFEPIALDTVKLAKILIPQAPGFNLNDLSKHFNLFFENAHDALADAQLTTQLLHHLAMRVQDLPKGVLLNMRPFVEALPNEEIELFDQPSLFTLNQDAISEAPFIRKSIANEGKVGHSNQQFAQLILEKTNEKKQIVVEDALQPINEELVQSLISELLNQNQAFALAVTRSNRLKDWLSFLKDQVSAEDILVLKNARHFIHVGAFKRLLEIYQPSPSSNQQELIIIAATINWLSFTKNGDYDELNQELCAQALLSKYTERYLSNRSHQFYQNMIEKSYLARVILMDHRFLSELTRYYDQVNQALFKRTLLIDNLSFYTKRVRQTYQDKFSISEWFTRTRLLIDQLTYHSLETTSSSHFLKKLQEFTEAFNELFNYCQFLLKGLPKNKLKKTKVEHFISTKDTASQYFSQVITTIQAIYSDLERLVELDNHRLKNTISEVDPNWLYHFRLLKHSLRHNIANAYGASYWLIKAEYIQGQFFHVELIKERLVLEESHINYLRKFEQLLFLSPGDLHYLQNNGTYEWLQLHNFYFYSLPKVSQLAPLNIKVPIEFIQESDESIATQKFEKLHCQFIEENIDSLADYLLIIVNGKAAAQETYRILSKSEVIKTHFSLHAQGVSGSLKKIKRRAQEMKPSIVALSWNALLTEQWRIPNETFDILISSLPFNSPKNSLMLAMSEYLKETDETDFHEVLLPQMIQDFKVLTNYLRDSFEINTAYLFDERVYTKYYSQQVREQLEVLVNFEISQ